MFRCLFVCVHASASFFVFSLYELLFLLHFPDIMILINLSFFILRCIVLSYVLQFSEFSQRVRGVAFTDSVHEGDIEFVLYVHCLIW